MGSAAARFDRSAAEKVLAQVCAGAAVDPEDAELIRLGSAAVFRLRRSPVIVRIGRNGDKLPVARREVAVARWLAAAGVPASRALDVDQPMVVDGHVATLWESAAEQDEYGSTADLALLLRRLHALPPPVGPELPELDPFTTTAERIASSAALADNDRAFLQTRHADLARSYGDLRFALPEGVIHGDASVGNVIKGRDGAPLLVDLDGVALGPREWDLVLTALYYERFGWHTAAEYAAFVEIIGFDVMTWPGYQVLADVRELLMVAWLAHTASDEVRRAELAKRVAALRTDADRTDWAPY